MPDKKTKLELSSSESSGGDVEDEVDEKTDARCNDAFEGCQNRVASFFSKNSEVIKILFWVTLVAAYSAYFAYALYYEFGSEASIRLLWVTMTVVTCFAICIIQDHCGDSINKNLIQPIVGFIRRHWSFFKW